MDTRECANKHMRLWAQAQVRAPARVPTSSGPWTGTGLHGALQRQGLRGLGTLLRGILWRDNCARVSIQRSGIMTRLLTIVDCA
eukprot:6947851-Alexandrium_andersonii.AAC.1